MRLYDGAYVRFAQDVQVNLIDVTKKSSTDDKCLDSHIRKQSLEWPHIRDGVYVLIRAHGAAKPEELSRMWRNDTIAVATQHEEQFAYFLIMAGDDLGDIASLIAACSRG
jgi:hypothetical protein